jgi:hypothetical protein
MAAGNDAAVTFYDKDGKISQRFDFSHDENEGDFTVADVNPSGRCIVLGSFNRYPCSLF